MNKNAPSRNVGVEVVVAAAVLLAIGAAWSQGAPSHKPSSSWSTAGNLQVWSGQSSGTLQLSEYRNGQWAAATTIEDQVPEPGLGRSIVTDGETILAGAQGAAYVYRKHGLIWSRVGRLTPDAPVPDFGASVAIRQSALVVAGIRSAFFPNWTTVGSLRNERAPPTRIR